MKELCCVGLLFLTVAGSASPLAVEVTLSSGESVVVQSPAAADDRSFENPAGYEAPDFPARFFNVRTTIENLSERPVADYAVWTQPLAADPASQFAPADLGIYAAWLGSRFHGSTGLREDRCGNDVREWVACTLCGSDVYALGGLMRAAGITSRRVPLSGHVVSEYDLGSGPAILDGDQNCLYFPIGSMVPASWEDILRDPLIVLRTKVYGRLSRWDPAAAWRNMSRFPYARPQPAGREMRFPLGVGAGFRFPRLEPWGRTTIEFPEAARVLPGNSETNPLPETLQANLRKVLTRVQSLPSGNETAAVRWTLPRLVSGPTRVGFRSSDPAAKVRVVFELDPSVSLDQVPPAPGVRVDPSRGRIEFEATGERVWWQISYDTRFERVPSSFDQVQDFPASGHVDLPLIHQTLLLASAPHFIRARVLRRGVWSQWSSPIEFQPQKPPRPLGVRAETSPHGVVVSWKPQPGKMKIFGSDRFDFLPDVYRMDEPTLVADGRPLESTASRNLLKEIDARAGSAAVPTRQVYRVICEAEDTLSLPSPPVILFAPFLPKLIVLTNVHTKESEESTSRDLGSLVRMK